MTHCMVLSKGKLQLNWGSSPQVQTIGSTSSPARSLSTSMKNVSAWCRLEMRAVGIEGYFNPIIISGDFGYRKPDHRLFTAALKALKLTPENVLFVGNDMFRDIYPANQLGIKSVFFSSNQGSKQHDCAKPDYIIYQFCEMRQAIAFFESL